MYWERTRTVSKPFYRLFANPAGPALKTTKNPLRALWWRLRYRELPKVDPHWHPAFGEYIIRPSTDQEPADND